MTQLQWHTICDASDLTEQVGTRALVGQDQVAIFKVEGALYAIGAIDPFTHAAVLSRGMIGSLQSRIVVASPLLKQHFDLETGECLEDDTVSVATYPIKEEGGKILVAPAQEVAVS